MTCAGKLKNIRFRRVGARILSIEHITRVLVDWELEPTSQNLSDLKFFIERAEGPSEWETLNAEGIAADEILQFIDYTAKLFDFDKVYSYRIRADELDAEGKTLQSFFSAVTDTQGELDYTALFVVEEVLFQHRFVTGAPTLIYKKRHDGLTCPSCFDTVLKRITKSNCTVCFGTGKLEGYYPPMEAWVTYGMRQNQANVQTQGVTQPNNVTGEFTNYPDVRIGDLLFDIKDHVFWRVVQTQAPEKNHVPILQQLSLVAVNRSDVEHRLKIPQDICQRMMREFNERLKETEF